MTRALRIEYPWATYHVTSKTNEKKAIFLNKENRRTFPGVLSLVVERYSWARYGRYGARLVAGLVAEDARMLVPLKKTLCGFTKHFAKTIQEVIDG